MPPKQKKGTTKGSRKSQVPAKPPKPSPAPVEMPQEIIDQIVDELTSNLDLKSSSLISRAWTSRSQQKLFRHITLAPTDIKPWLSKSKPTAAAVNPWITKFELRDNPQNEGSTMPWDHPLTLSRLISPLASSPIQHLTIIPFNMRLFRKSSLFRCFEPVAGSLCSLELRFLKTCSQALTFLISMFPNLDDILLERISATPMTWPKGEHGFEDIPSFAGTFEYLDIYDGILPALLSWIMEFPLWFHTISPGMLKRDDVPMFAKLVEICSSTLQEIPHVMFDADVRPEHVVGILSPCTNLRMVGVLDSQFGHVSPMAVTMLRSLRSRQISVIYIEIIETLRTLQVDHVWNNQGWREFEDLLCQLAEERIDDDDELVLELGIWRNPRLKACGPLDPGKMLPRFRKKGSIRFAPPPEDPDYAAVLDYKYSSDEREITTTVLQTLYGLMSGH